MTTSSDDGQTTSATSTTPLGVPGEAESAPPAADLPVAAAAQSGLRAAESADRDGSPGSDSRAPPQPPRPIASAQPAAQASAIASGKPASESELEVDRVASEPLSHSASHSHTVPVACALAIPVAHTGTRSHTQWTALSPAGIPAGRA